MYHTLIVCISDGPGDFGHQYSGLVRRNGGALDFGGEGLSADVFHGKKWPATPLAEFENGHNMRMLQGGQNLGFAAEPFEGLRREVAFVDRFQSHPAIESPVHALIDMAHSARINFAENAISTNLEFVGAVGCIPEAFEDLPRQALIAFWIAGFDRACGRIHRHGDLFRQLIELLLTGLAVDAMINQNGFIHEFVFE